MNRRTFVLCLAVVVTGPMTNALAQGGPADVVGAIYRRAAAGKGDSGGQFLWLRARDRRVHFTRRTAELWERADRITHKGDQNPPGFDPVTASQDPALKSFTLVAEEEGSERARILVRLVGREGGGKPYASVRYHLVREGGGWLIDDIAGEADGQGWSIRDILQSHLAAYAKPAGRSSPPGHAPSR